MEAADRLLGERLAAPQDGDSAHDQALHLPFPPGLLRLSWLPEGIRPGGWFPGGSGLAGFPPGEHRRRPGEAHVVGQVVLGSQHLGPHRKRNEIEERERRRGSCCRRERK